MIDNATVNGVPFKSTTVQGTLKNGLITVTGGTFLKTDTTAIGVGFSQNVTINTQNTFNDPNKNGLVYLDTKTSGIYSTDSSKKATGLYTVTSFNTKDSTVAGTFSGTVADVYGTSTLTITNGSFYSKGCHGSSVEELSGDYFFRDDGKPINLLINHLPNRKNIYSSV